MRQTTAVFFAAAFSCLTAVAAAQQSAARQWDEQILSAIRLDTPRPPVHARNLYHLSAAMYDAWAAYDAGAGQVFHHEHITLPPGDIEAARHQAVSYAAYRVIRHRYQAGPNAAATRTAIDAKMAALGYDVNNTSTVGNSPAALGNRIFETLKQITLLDGSNESGNYARNNGYAPANAVQPIFYDSPGVNYPEPNWGWDASYPPFPDPNRWQPLFLDSYFFQNGLPAGSNIQTAVCPHWGGVVPFALNGPHPNNVYLDPGPQARLGDPLTDADYKATYVEVIRKSAQLTTADGVMIDIGPATHHNNPLGTNDGTGYGTNPITGQPYAPNMVLRGDYTRCLAQFWADGPHSETPPGHWNVIANNASDSPLMIKRIGGTGPIVNNLEWDVKLYLTLNGAVHDAAIACWGAKGYYDSSRPITAIRFMCLHGQSTTPGSGQGYNVKGIPLVPDLIERATAATLAPGGRHASIGNAYEDYYGEPEYRTQAAGRIVIKGWRGRGTIIGGTTANPRGVDWIEGVDWLPYQADTFVTPAFPGYYSGHSTFSRSAAEVLSLFTGSEYFPGGFASYTLPANFLRPLEDGPVQPISLQWAKYFDAADEAGVSRIYGGIHPPMDDRAGRMTGHVIGPTAWQKALKYFYPCKADIGSQGGVPGGDAQLNNNDFVVFIDYFFGHDPRADVGVQGGIQGSDGFFDSNDIVAFIDAFFIGCN